MLAAAREESRHLPHLAPIVYGGITRYLILFAPHAFASQRQYRPRAAFAIGVLPDICAFHRYTRNSTLLFRTLARRFLSTSG